MPPKHGSAQGSASRGQSTISSFFSPRSSPAKQKSSLKRGVTTVIDLTSDGEGEDQRTPKRPRVSQTSPASPYFQQGSSKDTTADPEEWAFRQSQTQHADTEPRSAADEKARLARREAFKRKLLGENNLFVQRQRALDGHNLEDGEAGGAEEEHPGRESSGDESDNKLKELLSHFEMDSQKKKGNRSKGKPKARPKPKELGPMGEPWTDLERQVHELKAKHKDTILMIEVGYKYVFFGEDAKVASKELGIVCYPKGNFFRASIPVDRREVHLKKLLAQGHKVGIVDQTETAALKQASDTRNKLFSRNLSHLYTAATYVDDLDSVDDLERSSAPSLVSLVEERMGGMGTDERVGIGMVVICPSTGDVIWDNFEDSHMRIDLETRLSHTRPMEMLLPAGSLSEPTEKMLNHFVSPEGRKVRTERTKDTMPYSEAFNLVTSFYTENSNIVGASDSFKSGQLLATAMAFPKRVIIALAHAIKYLSDFQLAKVLIRTEFFDEFSKRTTMLLHGNTLTNLEIYRNETNYSVRGSLLSILDRTRTKFGSRMLRRWIGQPLVDLGLLQERFEAVEEIIGNQSPRLVALGELLKGLPDLAKGLSRIQYGYCTPKELAIVLRAFQKAALAFPSADATEPAQFRSKLLQDILTALPRLREPVQSVLSEVSLKIMEAGDKEGMWLDADKYPDIAEYAAAAQAAEAELTEELESIRKVLKKPSLSWTTVANEEYLVEIRKDENRNIPATWQLISSTKYCRRYRTPEVKTKMLHRQQYIEARQEAAKRAFKSFLQEIAQKYYGIFRDVVAKLATADCLLSLALVGLTHGYVRPEFTEDDTLEIVGGRHPVIEQLRDQPFIPNSICLGNLEARSKIITGPNMGGKSSCVKMIAVITIMAQIGSFVPASRARMGVVDGIYTRMGASDEIMKGRSTFMVEMTETSEILHSATPKSLVIADELGRGTSTFDGMAIAHAVLQHLVESVKCKTLFITHYPLVATEIEKQFPNFVQNLHMGFTEESRIDGSTDITFLYQLSPGLAEASFGIECARLANLPSKVLHVARQSAEKLRSQVEERTRINQ
ncbi:hypothetical protein GLOTRDRAFT_137270 [Gloeophyllum trabeum ATCC 11539]|uniref:DNA mismatch repair protein MSH3 n=1 Tax=Gloeophyllum trabeum (strain ATCC 11539 / FP-39264 / Madison 617) TaxID=670483 RepID=S7RV21_GLOTA|nr:uncharacterized protein GLOTRDRAFT_137270 [Gloeophyllum trabeum ATCC 11539]EPQ58610.1 hypothetical protein GLOTRDRAFT_137270 [Gloeophyllum trabeum ATCC 11539]